MQSKILQVYGKVHGVGFRYFVYEAARRYTLKGFVKNVRDGSVYIEAEGEEFRFEMFQEACKSGPTRARVDDLKIVDKPFQGFTSFEIR